jgi:hypothetical protein
MQRIIVVASPNVQNNFRLQLFDERKLKQDGILWNLNTCIGNSLLNEINPTNMAGLTREKITAQIHSLINQYYVFMGYTELANYIRKRTQPEITGNPAEERKQEIKKIRKFFNNQLIIIDEVHNIRLAQENKTGKKTASLLLHVARYAENMRLLLLSATPMYNSYKEIIWLTNLMNAVDKRSLIREEDVFAKDDSEDIFIEPRQTTDGRQLEGGRDLLKRKLTGYVSYVRGENPFSFPYRIYPEVFSPNKQYTLEEERFEYPKVQMNLKPIENELTNLPVFITQIGDYQQRVYNFVMKYLRERSFNTFSVMGQERDMPSFENMESFGYTVLKEPLEALNIVYPNPNFKFKPIIKMQKGGSNPNAQMRLEDPQLPVEEEAEEEEEDVEEEAEEEEEEDVEEEDVDDDVDETQINLEDIEDEKNEFDEIDNELQKQEPDLTSQFPPISNLEQESYPELSSEQDSSLANSSSEQDYSLSQDYPLDDSSIVPMPAQMQEQVPLQVQEQVPLQVQEQVPLQVQEQVQVQVQEPAPVPVPVPVPVQGKESSILTSISSAISSVFTPTKTESTESSSNESSSSVSTDSTESKESAELYDFDVSDIEANGELIKSMTGKQGLSNVMTYKTIRSQYELRYDFEYKPEFLQTYKRMFNPVNIKTYSSKIAKICDCIRKSTGIIIVYSQYIDGGVVPLALALEEMGFTRYGSANYTRPLFKTPPPVDPIDSQTMLSRTDFIRKQQESGNKTQFNQAKYVMITGDKSFSPDNLADIKYVTNQNNKYGEKVKVILITKAAAEGLDFKYIRQVHILEPWYNMNRIEQIIGRGVRNLSHCGLPFKERNVEIYLHASKPLDDEEPADLYVYRFAKNKAVKIGEVTRLLKTIATDCILNIGQSNFTVEKLSRLVQDQNIRITLSSKLDGEPQDIQFQIGDKPHTDICDYKDDCRFTCSPMAEIGEADLNKNMYTEDYTRMNYSAIMKRIRQLFKEQSFYTRKQLLLLINALRKYPDEHVDYTLSQFIDNKNELIVDKHGNTGYLINADDVYAFQPIEITDEQVTILDRSKPVAHHNSKLEMELPKEKDKDELDVEEPEYINVLDKIIKLWDTIIKEVDDAANNIKLASGEVDWYVNLGRVYQLLLERSVSVAFIQKAAVYHYLDTLSKMEKLSIVNFLYKKSIFTPTINPVIENIIFEYFNSKTMESRRGKGIYISGDNQATLYILNTKTNEWDIAEPAQKPDFKIMIQQKYLIQPTVTVNEFVGFMHLFKDEMVFKTKDMTEVRNNFGAKCSSAGKLDVIKRLNQLISTCPIVEERQFRYDAKDNAKDIVRTGFCVILEVLMRFYNTLLPNHLWFLDVEQTLANELISRKYNAVSKKLI